jgi:hypothetical protein
MTSSNRQLILRAHALYLGIAAVLGFLFLDMRGFVFNSGPAGEVAGAAPYTIVGFVEAHGLAFILALLFWRAAPVRMWHVTAMATAALLGTANVVFWQIFVITDTLVMGYVTTGLHWTFTAAELAAAVAVKDDVRTAAGPDLAGVAGAR